MKTILAIAAATVLATVAGHAAAQDSSDARTVAVSYADLDLSRASGRATMERRIESAVQHVCPTPASTQDLTARHYSDKCRTTALAGAQHQLAQVYDGRALAQAAIEVGPGKR